MHTMERDIVTGPGSLLQPNIGQTGRAICYQADARFRCRILHADKTYGTVVSSKELSEQQCLLHLDDSKGPTAGYE